MTKCSRDLLSGTALTQNSVHRGPKEMKSSPVTQLKVRQGNTSANALKNISSHSWVAQQGRDRRVQQQCCSLRAPRDRNTTGRGEGGKCCQGCEHHIPGPWEAGMALRDMNLTDKGAGEGRKGSQVNK